MRPSAELTAPLPCTADGWPFHGDPRTFEARRAVGQLVRTMQTLTDGSVPDVLQYIHAADSLVSAIREEVLPELVAQARANGAPWSDIGSLLGTSAAEAQRRFGAGQELPAESVEMAKEARQVVRLSNSLVRQPHFET